MHYRTLIDLDKHLSPDVAAINNLPQKMAVPRVDILPSKGKVHSALEERFLALWLTLGGPPLEREVRFHPVRRWRLDFAIVDKRIAFEIQGGINNPNSGHRSKQGISRDYEKHNAALMLGWQLFFVTAKAIDDTALLEQLIAYCQVL